MNEIWITEKSWNFHTVLLFTWLSRGRWGSWSCVWGCSMVMMASNNKVHYTRGWGIGCCPWKQISGLPTFDKVYMAKMQNFSWKSLAVVTANFSDTIFVKESWIHWWVKAQCLLWDNFRVIDLHIQCSRYERSFWADLWSKMSISNQFESI